MSQRRMVLMTTGYRKGASPKTAVNLLRYTPSEVVAVLDPVDAGSRAGDVFGVGGAIPIIASLTDAPEANTLVIGVAPAGGKLPAEMRATVLEAASRSMTIISGLHEFLGDDPEIASAVRQHNARIWDVRKSHEREVAHRKNLDPRCLRIHTVGHDCNVGKMVVSLEVARALQRVGHSAKFVATGQTGMMIEGDGCAVDAVVADFVNGAAERLVLANQHHSILLVEGQGCITHPRYSAVTLGLLHGCVPDGLILCYEMGRERVSGMDHMRIPSLTVLRDLYERMASVNHSCRVIGVGLNSRAASAAAAKAERGRVRAELGLPVCDVIRDGPDDLVRAILEFKRELGK